MELYIHIPFCVRKCLYCDFLSGPAQKETQEAYLSALLREIDQTGRETAEHGETVTSVFMGGGTPSAVEPRWIARIMERVRDSFPVEREAEITMEANPGTLTGEALRVYRQVGINRLSIGLQTTDNGELKRIGRIHTYEEFLENYQLAREAGFTNLNVDLMSSLPGQTVQSYEKTLERVIRLEPEHISAYSLIVEEGTPFWDRYAKHPELLPTEEEDRQMYHLTKEILGQAGYERYEISNYAKPGYECRHNVGYWTRVPYLGLGLGAASFYGNQRYSNTRQMLRYLAVLENGGELLELREETQRLTDKDAMEEFMFLGLRLTAGIRAADFQKAFGQEIETVYGPALKCLTQEGLLESTKAGWRLSEWGLDVSNRVLAEFLLD